ncbi:hypothetical protein ACWC2T_20575 [Streptomyces sp. NPDC001393]
MPDLAARLAGLRFDTPDPRLRCLAAEAQDGEIVGYATCAAEQSTWDGRNTCTWTACSWPPATAASA